MKILTVFGTRPEAIKLFPLLHALRDDPRFESRVCVTAQHREMLDQVLAFAGIVPDHDLGLMRDRQSLDTLNARILVEVGGVLEAERPDWVVVQGDTTTAFAAALAAHYHRIPVCHVEAGLRSGDLANPWPEEMNRRAIATFAALHCAPTGLAADNLVRESIERERIHITGNTVIDALLWARERVREAPESTRIMRELERRFEGRRIVRISAHRRENFGHMREIASAIRRLSQRDDLAIVFPVHRNPAVRDVMQVELSGLDNVALIDPLDYPNFVRLLDIAHLMLTDSGGVQEEAPALGTPVLVMRETTERPEAIAAGTARLVGTDPERIVNEVTRLLDDSETHAAMASAHNPYGDGQAASRICDLLKEAPR
ncbi:UDP-N-acetylglucosamine 2-epimerase (non-hydrolyzing) [Erythrobacter litoralis]|uniref:non-hydrolyzing UDP-N-acetylglucosamine 2-epimerase n=1 Tax=Erythrobacter litoralis TaxID=39960 RepID=UPI002435808B|nr:UDP-N-acetylglucosamine 2-epimerase (non-hydrolyzing) [Erythrobacter litoralis]MDG6079508.1 UDP-N-acetylglucosamine 2-epimerase (non-hydrolyzing) [Erythrobacter litoralis]